MSYVGKLVIIPPGTVFWTNHPKRKGDQARPCVWRVHVKHEVRGVQKQVQWQYHGRYWAWTDTDKVRLAFPDGWPYGVNR